MEAEQQEQEAWESLDCDDSDIISSSFSLRRCSRLPRHHKQLPSHHHHQEQPPLPRSIPGPASAIQAAMHRKDRHTLPHNGGGNADLVDISTQEYIRRVEEDSGEEFCRDPWLFAHDTLGNDGVFSSTSLKDIKKCLNGERIDKVIAIVKSCTPNGLGDMIVTLKDPTDTISASVHRKVLSEGEFGKLITAGSILILQKVVAFSSSCASCYLNITRRNVVKVISVDCEVQYFPETNLNTTQVCSRNTEIPDKATAIVSRRTGRLYEDVQLSNNLNDEIVVEKLTGREYCTQTSSLSSRKYIDSSGYNISKEHDHVARLDSGHNASGSFSQRRGNSCRATQPGTETVEGVGRSLQNLDNAERQRQAGDFSSAPCAVVNVGDQDAWQETGPELERLLRRNNCTTSITGKRHNPVLNPAFRSCATAENLDELDPCTRDDAQKHNRLPMGIRSTPTSAEKLVSRDLSKPNDAESTGSGGFKKQRLGLITTTSVQEWTDEQLGVLEMDDD